MGGGLCGQPEFDDCAFVDVEGGGEEQGLFQLLLIFIGACASDDVSIDEKVRHDGGGLSKVECGPECKGVGACFRARECG